MLRIVVLGAAAGGGVPQWNCGCAVCRSARTGAPGLQSTQASIAISADDRHWFVVNASPDLRQQITNTPQLHPADGKLRHSPITGVILTNGEVDAIAGLLSLRESSPFSIYAHPRVLALLKANPIFNVLNPELVPRIPIVVEAAFEPDLPDGTASGIEVVPFLVPGKEALYLESKGRPLGAEQPGDTLGLEIRHKPSASRLFYIAACAAVTPELRKRIAGAELVFFDGTLWRDDEMIASGLGHKSGQRMGHIAMDGEHGSVAALGDLGIARKVFLHINNSNPVLLPHSPERAAAERAGWRIPSDGTEVTL